MKPIFIALLLVCGLARCSCNDGILDPRPPITWSCEPAPEGEGRRPLQTEQACDTGERFVFGQCSAEQRCDARDDGRATCCPGTFCNSGGACEIPAIRIDTCTGDSGCPMGQLCLERPHMSAEKTCGFSATDSEGLCPDGGTPFNQRCVVGLPCEGGCATGFVCNIDTNQCEAPPGYLIEESGCEQSCDSDAMLVYTDPNAMLFAGCCAVSCICAPLPDLPVGSWGRFSDIALADDGTLHISGYNATYGDLMAAKIKPDFTRYESITYVDGLPSDVNASNRGGNPLGPRLGVSTPAGDVGQYSSLVLNSAGLPRIAYYDVDHKQLKLALATADGWDISLIDANFSVGRFTSLAIDANDILHISYYRAPLNRLRDGVDEISTGAIYARTLSAIPAAPNDWEHVLVDQIAHCDGRCGTDESCVWISGVATCATSLDRTTEIACSSCGCTESCAKPGASAAGCFLTLANFVGTPCPEGCNGNACVATADGSSWQCLAESAGGCISPCAAGALCVSDESGAKMCRAERIVPSDNWENGVGLYTSLVLDNGVPTITYFDGTLGILRGAVALFDGQGAVSLGFNTDTLACDLGHAVGLHSDLAVDENGHLGVAYQGNSGENLWFLQARHLLNDRDLAVLVDSGVRDTRLDLVGAYPSIGFVGTTPYIAYTDQTLNDLLLAYPSTSTQTATGSGSGWTYTGIERTGAFGGSTKLLIKDSNTAYITSYKRGWSAVFGDDSALVINSVDLSILP